MKPRFLLAFFFLPATLFSQDNQDALSVSRQYADKAIDLLKHHPDSAHYYLNFAVALAKKSESEDDLYHAFMDKAELFDFTGNADSSKFYHDLLVDSAYSNNASPEIKVKIFYRNGPYLKRKNDFFRALNMLDSAQHISLELNDSVYLADILNRKGSVYETMGKRSSALEAYLQALDIYEKYNEEDAYGNMINNIAISYKKAGDFENAMLYYNESVQIEQEKDDKGSEAVTRINRGLLYKDLGDYDEALSDMRFSLNQFKKENFHYGIAVCQHNLGEAHLSAGNLDSALFYLNTSQVAAEDFEFHELLVKNNLAIAKVERAKGNFNTSVQFAQKAYQLAKEREVTEDLRDINLLLADNFTDQGNFRNALLHFKEYKSAEDSLLSRESRFKLNILRTEYDLKYKDNEIAALEAKNKYQSELASEQKRANTLLIIGFIVSAAFLVIVFFLYHRQMSLSEKLSNQKNQLIEQKEEIESAQDQIMEQNEKLVNLNKEKDNLIAMVAHDLRSPLNQIRGVLGLVKMNNKDEASRQLLDVANESSEVLSERINRILDIEAINAGKINLKIKPLEAPKILKYLKQNILNIAVQKNMNLVIDAGENINCLGDENYLLQVLENLCTNAIKYSPENSEIKISAFSKDKNLLFAVKDEGPGIDEKELSMLFLPYSKTSNKPTGDETSTGLGLAIVKKYVEAMEGEVWCESQPNKGSVFYVKLPKAA